LLQPGRGDRGERPQQAPHGDGGAHACLVRMGGRGAEDGSLIHTRDVHPRTPAPERCIGSSSRTDPDILAAGPAQCSAESPVYARREEPRLRLTFAGARREARGTNESCCMTAL
jgi:hypothetical protein